MSLDHPAPARAPSSLLAFLGRLDPDQRRVVLAPPGPLLVLAGAGAGKTLTLAARVAYAIATGRVAAHHVLALSFTARAARELRERIARLAGAEAARGVECATHHAVCHRLLRRHAGRIARTPRFSVYEPADVLAILRRALADAGPGAPEPEPVAEAIARAKEGLLTPGGLRERAPDAATLLVARVWAQLEAELERSDALDFDDLLVRSARLLRDDPAVLADARARWRFVLVDEFQDTNRPQWTWLELVGGERPDLTAMGDDDQAIYSWRGGAVGNILEIDRRVAGTRVRTLGRNYRSAGAIVCAAARLIETNPQRRPKRIWTPSPRGTPVARRGFLDEDAEAAAVARWCAARIAAGAAPERLAALFRARRLAGPLGAALLAAGVPHRVLGGRGLLAHAELRDALAHLRILANPRDRDAFRRAAATLPGVGPKAIERVLERGGDPLRAAAADDGERLAGVAAKPRAALAAWAAALLALRDAPLALPQLVGAAVRASGLPERFAPAGAAPDEARLERLRGLVRVAREHAAREPHADLAAFLAALAVASGEDGAGPDGELAGVRGRVTLATVHAAKGLEWDAVWVCGLEEGTLPAERALALGELAEERRLAYVAITRARRELVLSHVRRRAQRWDLEPSRFLAEALGGGDSSGPGA
jgi:DNA helicase-2/ATP-dependent DNA helicase PcrA